MAPYYRELAAALPLLQINQFRVIPKGHNTGMWHLITDLSWTGWVYLSVVRSMQISPGLPDGRDVSSMPILWRAQAGIQRTRVLWDSPPRVRLPVIVNILTDIRQHLSTSSCGNRQVLWAIATIAFSGSSSSESCSQRQGQHTTQ